MDGKTRLGSGGEWTKVLGSSSFCACDELAIRPVSLRKWKAVLEMCLLSRILHVLVCWHCVSLFGTRQSLVMVGWTKIEDVVLLARMQLAALPRVSG